MIAKYRKFTEAERIFNTTVTMYNRYQDTTGVWTSIRTIIPWVHYAPNSVSIFNTTGTTVSLNINMVILRYRNEGDPIMVTDNEWNKLPRIEVETGGYFPAIYSTYTIVVPWAHDYVFPWFASSSLLSTAESNFKNSVQPSGTTALYRIPRDVQISFYGRPELHNVQYKLGT